MYLIFLYLMSYRAGRGLWLHGVLGCTLFALFILHHLLNLRWYRGLKKGKYGFLRMQFVLIDFVFLADMLVMAVSSVMMSGDVFRFSPLITTQTGRSLHILSTAWGFVIMILHLGLHLYAPFEGLRKKAAGTVFVYSYYLIFVLVLVFGLWCFVKSSLWQGMLLIPKSAAFPGLLLFYLQYLMITLPGCQMMYLLRKVSGRRRSKDKKKRTEGDVDAGPAPK